MIVTRGRRRRARAVAGLEALTARLARRTGRNGVLDPAGGRASDPRTRTRRAARGLWRAYVRILMGKDCAGVLLRDATDPVIQMQLGDRIAACDQALADLGIAPRSDWRPASPIAFHDQHSGGAP